MRYYIIIYLLISLSINSFSQEFTVDWGVCFGDEYENSTSRAIGILPNKHIVNSLLVSSENDAYSNYHGGGDAWVIITDFNGNLVLESCFGGSDEDYIGEIEVFDEYIYFIGQTQSIDGDVQSEPVGGVADIWVVKTDFDLNIIWEKRYGSLGVQQFSNSDITEDGGLVLIMDFFVQGGGDVSEYYGNTDIWVCELDADGNIVWEKTLGNAYGNYADNIYRTSEGNTIVLGDINTASDMVDCYCHSTDGSRDIWLVALDDTGEILWQNCYGGSDWDLAYHITETDNGYTLVGLTRSTDGDISNSYGSDDLWLIGIDSLGNLEWEKSFGGTELDFGNRIYKTENNGFLLFGNTMSNDGVVNNTYCPNTQYNCPGTLWALELDSNNNMIWNKTYGSTMNNTGKKDMERAGERDFIIAGFVRYSDIHSGDVDCEPYPVNNGQSAWIYRLYDPTIGANTIGGNIKKLTVYPNPSSDQILIDLPEHHRKEEIKIIDVFGREIRILKALSQQNQILWNVQNVEAGIYFYSSKINGINYKGKIIIN